VTKKLPPAHIYAVALVLAAQLGCAFVLRKSEYLGGPPQKGDQRKHIRPPPHVGTPMLAYNMAGSTPAYTHLNLAQRAAAIYMDVDCNKFSPHSLRYGGVAAMCAKRVEMCIVAAYGGWKSNSDVLMDLYTHVSVADQHLASQAITSPEDPDCMALRLQDSARRASRTTYRPAEVTCSLGTCTPKAPKGPAPMPRASTAKQLKDWLANWRQQHR